ncbi:hypothetical protein FB446DRAFT_795867, partial [Lentinula raphanica]
MSSRNAGSSSSHKQYAVRELRSKVSAAKDLKFNTQLRPRDNITTKKPALFLPSTKRECDLLQRAWPSYSNSFGSAFELPRYAASDLIEFPQLPAKGYKTQIPDTFYPEQLVQLVDGFSTGAVCREEGYMLYRALLLVQEALADVMDEPKAKTKSALLAMLSNPSMTSALGYYRIFWHKSRSCPLFALRFISLFCDFAAKVLSSSEYSSKVYNEITHRGFGIDKGLRAQTWNLKGPSHSVTSLAIPLPLDPSTFEGQLLITVAQDGPASAVLRHPVTGNILLPDPSGLEDLPPASPLLNALDDDEVEGEGPASPIVENDGPASPIIPLEDDADDDDDGETEVSDELAIEDIFKAPKGKGKAKAPLETPIHRSPRVRPSKVSSARVGSPVASRPAPKPTKRVRESYSPVADVEMQEPLPKKAKTSAAPVKTAKETVSPLTADTAVSRTTKGSKAPAATTDLTTEPEAPLEHNDLDTKTHHVLFLTNPKFQVKTAFADLVEQDSGTK